MDTRVDEVANGLATRAGPRVVLFDFDGVLMRGDAFSRFVRSRLLKSWWRLLIALAVFPLLLPFYAIRAMRMPILGIFVRISLLAVGPSRFEALTRDFAREIVGKPRMFIRDGISAMRRHIVDGDRVVIVTGCEESLVRAIFEAVGLPDLEIIASRLRAGRLGMRKLVHNIGAAKPAQIALHGIDEPWDLAYSDSSRDIPMLKRAREAVLVNADARTALSVRRALGRDARQVNWF